MKYFLLLCVFLVSCSTPSEITVGEMRIKTGNQVGGTSETLITNNGTTIYHRINNEDSFREAAKVAKLGIAVSGAKSIINSLGSTYQSVTNAKTAANVSKTGLTEATKQKSAEELTKRAAIEVPVE